MSSKEVAERLKMHGRTVIGILKRLNVPSRGKGEAVKLAYARGRKRRLIGERNPNWAGGIIDRDGYKSLRMPEHPKANKRGYVAEHIYIWLNSGKQLPDGWLIHHINGIKNDNRIENLVAMPKQSHKTNLLLEAMRKRVRELERELAIYKAQAQVGSLSKQVLLARADAGNTEWYSG